MAEPFSIKGKKILVYDYGLFEVHALALAQAGASVRYFTPWAAAFSQFEYYAPGLGYEDEGLEKVYYFWENVDWAEMIFCPDVGPGDIMEYLRKHTNKPIFGAAISEQGGNRMEQERWFTRQAQKKLGLPTQETVRIKGIPKLREYLKTHPNKYVKLDKFRSEIESFEAKNYEEVKLYLDEIEVALGPFNETHEYVVEPFIEGVEPGFDCFFNGKDWVKPYLWGIEQSKAAYLGKFVEKLPTPLQLIADKLKPLLREIDYRGAFSSEARVTKDGTPYLIDVCCRFPAPLSAAYSLVMENFPEIIWKVASGEDVRIKNSARYVAAAPLGTKHAEKHYVKLDFPENLSKYIKLRVSAKVKGNYYGVKGTEVVFILCAAGDEYPKLIETIEALSKKVDTFGLDLDPIGGLHRIEELVLRYREYGMGEF